MPDASKMPQYRVLLSDQKVADVVSFIRSGWGYTASKVVEMRNGSDQEHILRMK